MPLQKRGKEKRENILYKHWNTKHLAYVFSIKMLFGARNFMNDVFFRYSILLMILLLNY